MDLHLWMNADLNSVRQKLFDGVLSLVPTTRWHEPADGGGTTIAGLALHLTRHHDLAVNTVVRDHEPLFAQHRPALGLEGHSTAVGLAEKEDLAATRAVPTAALLAYVGEVFDRTTQWLERLGSMVLDHTPASEHRLAERAHLDRAEVPWLFDMWAGKALWWFVQWPVIGHGHAHVGEAIAVRNRMGFSPF